MTSTVGVCARPSLWLELSSGVHLSSGPAAGLSPVRIVVQGQTNEQCAEWGQGEGVEEKQSTDILSDSVHICYEQFQTLPVKPRQY